MWSTESLLPRAMNDPAFLQPSVCSVARFSERWLNFGMVRPLSGQLRAISPLGKPEALPCAEPTNGWGFLFKERRPGDGPEPLMP